MRWLLVIALLAAGCGQDAGISLSEQGVPLPEPSAMRTASVELCDGDLPILPEASTDQLALCVPADVTASIPSDDTCPPDRRDACGACSIPYCADATDCALGQSCDDGLCQSRGANTDCRTHADCAAGTFCDGSRCRTRVCVDDDACPDGTRCLGLGAYPSLELLAATGDGLLISLDGVPIAADRAGPERFTLGGPAELPTTGSPLVAAGDVACSLDSTSITVDNVTLCTDATDTCCRNGVCCEEGVIHVGRRPLSREIRDLDGTPRITPTTFEASFGSWERILGVGEPLVLPPAPERAGRPRTRVWFSALANLAGSDQYHQSIGFAASPPEDLAALSIYRYNPVVDILSNLTTHLHEGAPTANTSAGGERLEELFFLRADGSGRGPRLGRATY